MKQNIDKEEVEKFNELAKDWWNPKGDFKSLHQINPLRINFIKERTSLAGKQVLDVGCGGGLLAEVLSDLGAIVTAIDASEKTIKIAKSHAKQVESNVTYIKASLEEFIEIEPRAKFDVITCLEMLEHVPQPFQILKSCSDLLNQNGDLFLSTINRNPRSYLFAIIGAEYLLNLLPKGTHDYSKFIKPSELSKWLKESNLNTLKTVGLSYNPITDHYWLGKDIAVNYLLHASKV